MRILSLTLEYPNPKAPTKGLFVRQRIRAMGLLAEVKVVCPVPLIEYHRTVWRNSVTVPLFPDPHVEVLYPAWVYPPFGTPINAACLAGAAVGPIARLQRRFSFDLLDGHFGYPDGVAAALLSAKFHVPFMVTLRGNEPFFAKNVAARTALRWALGRAARVIAVSHQLQEFAVCLGVAPERTSVIGNGVDADLFCPGRGYGWRERNGLPSGARVVVSAGSLVEAKGHQYVMRAIAQIPDHNLFLVIAGTETSAGPGYAAQLRHLARELHIAERTLFVGWLDGAALADALATADLFCLASHSEGWPNVVHEAVSSGTPVVVTDVGSVRQIVRDQVDGLIVPPRNQEALSSALSEALGRTWNRGEIARVGGSRTWSHVAAEVIAQAQRAVHP